MWTTGEYTELGKIRSRVISRAVNFGFSDDDAQKIALAVDEACSNLIQHAYNFDKKRKIGIAFSCEGYKFIIRIYDDGIPFDPKEVTPPDMKEYFKEFRRGGLGIHIIRKIMDEIEYIPGSGKNGRNLLELRKNLQS
ncbi:MAG: ATP-binding protein [Candidatus Kapaibacterium sp.]